MSRVLLFVALTPLLYILWESGVSQVFDGFQEKQLKGKRVFIGGASSGIGEQMAYKYCKFGAHVALLSRRRSALEKVASKCRSFGAASVVVVDADVSTVEASRAALWTALKAPGFDRKLDVLVLNHVIGMWGWWLPDKMDWKDFLPDDPHKRPDFIEPNEHANGLRGGYGFLEKVFRVNTFSYIYLSTMSMPFLEKSGGRIIVVSSGAGKMGLPKVAPYSATKHALHGFFDSLRLELIHKGLSVSISIGVIGNIDTEANKKNTAGDLNYVKRASKLDCALAIIRAGQAREREFFFPVEQGLHIISKIRPWMMNPFDKILLAVAQ
jgi:corticosteroid 11-beta-dehydrogenase isozyme 1